MLYVGAKWRSKWQCLVHILIHGSLAVTTQPPQKNKNKNQGPTHWELLLSSNACCRLTQHAARSTQQTCQCWLRQTLQHVYSNACLV